MLVFSLWSLVFGLALFYLLLIGFFTYGWFRKVKTIVDHPARDQRRVSVVVAAKNEEHCIKDLLNDLVNQDYPKDLVEIIIIDDNSEDGTNELVRDFNHDHPFEKIILLKTRDEDQSGKKAALTLGVKHAEGDIIVTTDADCRLGEGWISSFVSCFMDDRIKMVFGPVAYDFRNNFNDQFQTLEFSALVASGAGAALAGHPFLCNGANLAYRKEAFMQVKGFKGNEKFLSGDDVFLLHKIKREFGRKSIIFCKDKRSLVWTYPVKGFRDFISQRARWASKSKGYKDPLSVITAIIVFSYSLTVLLSFIAGFCASKFFLISGGLLLWKIVVDLPLMMRITGFFNQKKILKWYPVFQVIYPFYIVIAGFLSFIKRKGW